MRFQHSRRGVVSVIGPPEVHALLSSVPKLVSGRTRRHFDRVATVARVAA